MSPRLPVIAIVGRQNVGKSSLFNRIAGKPIAITEDQPGTTRDRIKASVTWEGKQFTLYDTGGLEHKPVSSIGRQVRRQAEIAVADADAIIFVVDVQAGVTAGDQEIAGLLRSSGRPVTLVAAKADNARLDAAAVEFYELGLGEPVAVSAFHNRGVAEMMDEVVSLLPEQVATATPDVEPVKAAIVGRPNVGKSMLLNALLGEERVIVTEVAGTTRDAIDTRLDFAGQNMVLIDTAGIRKRGRVDRGVEKYSVLRALEAIDRADVALLVLDASDLLSAQDMHIAGYIQQAARGVVLVVNKWDLVADKNQVEYTSNIRSQLKFMTFAPVLYVSAMTGEGIGKILPQVLEIQQERLKQVSPGAVSDLIHQSVAAHSPPRRGVRQLKIISATQSGTAPPTFTFRVNDAKLVHFSYRRYLENRLREKFGFGGTLIRLLFKSRGESQ